MTKTFAAVATFALTLLVTGLLASPSQAQSTGPTIAPDLVSVTDVSATNNDYNGSGTNDTTAVFTFDEPVSATCCSGYQLIPADLVNDKPLGAFRILAGEGTTELVVAFEGQLSAAETARGTVDKNTVKVSGGGSETFNPPQAAPVSNGGNTNAPDLRSVVRDGDSLLFTFDQPIDKDDDMIQNTSGLRFYTADARTFGSSVVNEVDGNTLRALYDLPQGTTLDDAVGGFTPQGTVVGADVDGDGTFEPNALDEELLGAPVDTTTCAPANVDETGLRAGRTVAPDLQFAGNFREGPFTDDGGRTTCVDFDFDQRSYLGGGNRTSFHLVPTDGGHVLDGTALRPDNDQEGDDKITVIFEGRVDESDFARGYVDGNVVTSNSNGDGPYNVAQSAAISNAGNSEDPDLQTISEKSDKKLYFEFDEDLDQEDVVQDTAGLRFYTAAGDVYTASRVKETNREDVLVAGFDLPKGVSSRDAVGGLVVQGTVVAPDDDADGTKEANSFDEIEKSDGKINKDGVTVLDG
ncbi:hypothetical protein [Rubrobacter aplysinae]|uniref:hypothetical protein n=1 Tax=Rubrobacter aplysinae TaxID=909625 RepID=UPI00064C43BA|nr:hypothetical protein [Rubrobacter aplysinae]